MMFKTKSLFAAAALTLAATTVPAVSATVTSNAGFSGSQVIDFSQFAATCAGFGSAGCTPNVDVGGLVGETVMFSGTDLGFDGASIYNGGFGLGANGSWDSGRNGYVGLNNQQGTGREAIFTFATGVSDVGAFVNYAPDGGGTPLIEALGVGGIVLETFDVSLDAPISTPGGLNEGAFRGFSRATNDILAIRFTDGFTVLDNLEFGRTAVVPLPATLPMLLGVLGLFGLVSRRRRNALA